LYNIDGWMVGWNPVMYGQDQDRYPPGAIEVGPHPDRTRWSQKNIATAGCCYSRWTELKTNQQKIDELIRGFFNLVLGDGLDPKAVHREFSKIEGYLDYEGNIGLGRGSYVFFQDGKLAPYNP
jgi:hypothetical protein